MDEKKEAQSSQEPTEGQQKEASNPPAAPADNSSPKDASIMDEAKAIAERIEKANAETRKLLERQEKLYAESMLTGKGLAGQGQPAKKEISDVEYAKALMKGEILK